jgi:hypothetical protein
MSRTTTTQRTAAASTTPTTDDTAARLAIADHAIEAHTTATAARVARGAGRHPQGPGGQRDLDRCAGDAANALRAAIVEYLRTGD